MDAGSQAAVVKLLLTPEEAAAVLSIRRTLLYSLLASKQVYSIKVGRTRRIPMAALHDYVARRCAGYASWLGGGGGGAWLGDAGTTKVAL